MITLPGLDPRQRKIIPEKFTAARVFDPGSGSWDPAGVMSQKKNNYGIRANMAVVWPE
ncbi:MAG: hypothetical protein RLZZ474_1412 [Bacteroidota bacterium]|jgi:hypothetical protein